ncbi:MAG: hypothetical protein IPF66_11570 [Holophagales bacterium]|nr:hypothetical protein [Holophagales bacterium]
MAILGLTTLGFPHTMMGISWIEDVLREAGKGMAKDEKKAAKKAKKAKKGK